MPCILCSVYSLDNSFYYIESKNIIFECDNYNKNNLQKKTTKKRNLVKNLR